VNVVNKKAEDILEKREELKSNWKYFLGRVRKRKEGMMNPSEMVIFILVVAGLYFIIRGFMS